MASWLTPFVTAFAYLAVQILWYASVAVPGIFALLADLLLILFRRVGISERPARLLAMTCSGTLVPLLLLTTFGSVVGSSSSSSTNWFLRLCEGTVIVTIWRLVRSFVEFFFSALAIFAQIFLTTVAVYSWTLQHPFLAGQLVLLATGIWLAM